MSAVDGGNNTTTNNYQQTLNSGSGPGVFNVRPEWGYDAAGEITQWGQQNSLTSPVIYEAGYDKAGQLTSFVGGRGTSPPPFASQYFYDFDPAANRTASQTSIVQVARIGGSKTTADTISIVISDPALSGGTETVTIPSSQATACLRLRPIWPPLLRQIPICRQLA